MSEILEGEVLAPERKVDPRHIKRPDLFDENGKFLKGNPAAWKIGNPGGPKGARQRVTHRFLSDLAKDYEQWGAGAIKRMRRAKPHEYVKIVAQLLPKQIEIKDEPFDGISTDELAAILDAVRRSLAAARGGGEGAAQAQLGEPAGALPAVR